jgi:hypothetical protein
MIRRRLSFADSRTSLDVLAAPEVRGAVMPNRVRPRPRSSMVEFGAESGGANISRTTSFSSISDLGLRNQRSAVSLRRGFELGRAATRHRRQSASFSSLNFDNSARTRARSVPPSPAASCMGQFEPVAEPEEMVDIVENLASPSCVRRMSSDDSFVFIPDSETVLPTIALPKKGAAHRAMTAPTPSTTASTIKRSLSFFGRLSPSSLSLHDTSEEGGDAKSVKSDKGDKSDKSDKPEKTEFGQKLTTSKSTSSISIPNTSDSSPPTLQGTKRRRSLRFFGQFRGFTPI